jgi:hypothetical protein
VKKVTLLSIDIENVTLLLDVIIDAAGVIHFINLFNSIVYAGTIFDPN